MLISKKTKRPIKEKSKYVKVVWRDIIGLTSSDNASAWMEKDQLMKEAKKMYDHEHITVGEIVGETDEFIVISATSDNDGLYNDSSMIMKSVIIRTEKL